jgi:hypothetical protein
MKLTENEFHERIKALETKMGFELRASQVLSIKKALVDEMRVSIEEFNNMAVELIRMEKKPNTAACREIIKGLRGKTTGRQITSVDCNVCDRMGFLYVTLPTGYQIVVGCGCENTPKWITDEAMISSLTLYQKKRRMEKNKERAVCIGKDPRRRTQYDEESGNWSCWGWTRKVMVDKFQLTPSHFRKFRDWARVGKGEKVNDVGNDCPF